MEKIDAVLKTMRFEFFGSGKHKISPCSYLAGENAFLLDVRSLRALGFEQVRIVEGGYAEFVEAFKPGKLLSQLQSRQGVDL